MGLKSRARTAAATGFLARVTQAVVEAAILINGEPAATAHAKQRTELALQVLRAPDTWGRIFAPGVAGALDGMDADTDLITDLLIEQRVAAVWNDYALAYTT